MNNRYEFRAWNNTNKSFVYANLNTAHNTLFYSWLSEPEQWTGLLDKNGKKIFEGDIVRWKQYEKTKEIFLFKGAFMLKDIDVSYPLHGMEEDVRPFVLKDIEIIGNKHEGVK